MLMEDNKIIDEETRVLDGYAYTYRLILHSERKFSTIGIPLYSISVTMTEIGTDKSTSARTKEIFSDVKKAKAFLMKLARNYATPIDLLYIVEDEFT